MSAPAQLVLVTTEPSHHRVSREREESVIAVSVETDERILLSIVEAAKRLGVGRSMMYELLGSGQIESIHIGRLHKVPVAALAAFVASARGESGRSAADAVTPQSGSAI